MTDKEQIIIDGVDVSKCEFYMHYDYGKFSHGCSLHKDMFGLPVCCDIADCCKDCYFKQLARKTQECERSRKRISDLEERIINHSNEIEEYCSRLADKNKKCEKYEQVMKNIEEICLKDVHTFADGTQLRYDSLDEILDIINKAKDGN